MVAAFPIKLATGEIEREGVQVRPDALGISPGEPYLVNDLLSGDQYIWQEERNCVELNPQVVPAHLFLVRRRLRWEEDFDCFM